MNLKHELKNQMIVSLLLSPISQTKNKNKAPTLGNISEAKRGNKKTDPGRCGFGAYWPWWQTAGVHQGFLPQLPPQKRAVAGEQLPRQGLHLPGRLRLRGDRYLIFASELWAEDMGITSGLRERRSKCIFTPLFPPLPSEAENYQAGRRGGQIHNSSGAWVPSDLGKQTCPSGASLWMWTRRNVAC